MASSSTEFLEWLQGEGAESSFEAQWEQFRKLDELRAPGEAPVAAWVPDEAALSESNLGRLMAERDETYEEVHAWSVRDRSAFWTRVVDDLGIRLERPAAQVLDESRGAEKPRWLSGARMNIADTCLRGDPDEAAILHASEENPAVRVVTRGDLARMASRVTTGLRVLGLQPGEAVGLYMPMTVECVAAYLGIVQAGLRVVSIADSFPPPELNRRAHIGGARALIVVDQYVRAGKVVDLYAKARKAEAPRCIVISGEARPQLRRDDMHWGDFLGEVDDDARHSAEPEEVTNVLFSSGTTGTPKAIPWTHLTPVKCAMDGRFHHDIRRGDVVAWPTNIGWMMGPWLIYASLVNGASMALYEGSPGGAGFCRFVRDANVTMLGVVPSLVRAWRKNGATDDIAWESVRVFSSTGEPSNREDYLWLMSRVNYRAPVIEYCGGTGIGGGHLTGTVVQPASPTTFSTPALGLDFVLLDEEGAETDAGEIFLRPPSMGLSQMLLNGDHHRVYYRDCPKAPDGGVLRRHGDAVERLAGGYYRAHGRADDTMNLGGIKVSSREIELLVDGNHSIYESAAVAVRPGGEGADRLVLFVVLMEGRTVDGLKEDLGRMISSELNPLFKVHDVVAVESLPRTASNKVMRRTLRAEYD